MIQEESAQLPFEDPKIISKKLSVFYNPVMKLNRDVSVLLLNCVENKNMQMILPLAGSGVRGIRMLKELKEEKIKSLHMNDYETAEQIKSHLTLNQVESTVTALDANECMLQGKGFDYIDIDPFGSPNPFLDASIKRLSRGGILAVTATDTSGLAGSHPKACKRKYWATPLHNELMHEIAIRILIRKIQLLGAQFEKGLLPLFCFAKDHYYRIFLVCKKSKTYVDSLLKQHRYFLYNPKTMDREICVHNNKKGYLFAGPIWTGQLWDKNLVQKMYASHNLDNNSLHELLSIIKEESTIDTVGFYDLHKLSKINKTPAPKTEKFLSKTCVRTHFIGWGVKSVDKPLF